MPTWHGSAQPLILPAGPLHARPTTLTVWPGTGNVQIQFQNPAGAWFTPAGEEFTIATAGPVRLERANTPEIRILATGDAQFLHSEGA